jgi:16S rRNA (guanine966-N2)-methyltransferase
MRVIGGSLGGRVLRIPRDAAFRPTTDRLREALFSILHTTLALETCLVCDLFAGSGSVGIEALSRGAAGATFVEKNRNHAAVLKANLTALALLRNTTVLVSPAEAVLQSSPFRYDLLFADPPYDYGNYDVLLAGMNNALASEHSLAVLEHRSGMEFDVPPTLMVTDSRSYGNSAITFFRQRTGEVT